MGKKANNHVKFIITFTRMLYSLLRKIFRYAVSKYFKEIRLLNPELVPTNVPVIFFPNHRSAFMDPIVVATQIKRPVHFLARGESFTNPVLSFIFRHLHMIPIYRKKFSPGETHKNEDVFEHCFKLLESGGSLMIFPEGLSQTKPRLLPFKTGTARIAFGAEMLNDFNLNIHLVPVGINYSNPHRFQSDLLLDFGPPVKVSEYKQSYLDNPVEAVNQLTTDMEKALKDRIITIDGKRWFELSERVELIVKTEPEAFVKGAESGAFDWYLAKKDINAAIDYFKNYKPELLNHLEEKTDQYYQMLKRLNLSKQAVKLRKGFYNLENHFPSLVIFLIFFSPIFLIGFVLLGPPFFLTRMLAGVIVKRTDFMGSVILALGLLVFTAFGVAESVLLGKISGSWVSGAGLFIILPVLGLFTHRYFVHLLHFARNRRWITIDARKEKLAVYVMEEKRVLLGLFKEAYREYLAGKNEAVKNSGA